MTKLAAVNIVLRGVGMAGTSALNTGGNSEAAHAERALDLVIEEVQSEGWHFNTFTADLSPNGSDNIEVPAGTVRIKATGDDRDRNVTQRDDLLYDLDDNTDEFDAAVECEYVTTMTWDQTPHPIQNYIAHLAAERYYDQRVNPPNGARLAKLSMNTRHAKAEALRFDDDVRGTNVTTTDEHRRLKGDRIRIW